MCASLSTHVLDATRGGPRTDVPVTVSDEDGNVVGSGETDGEGRVPELATGLPPGRYQITWQCSGDFLTSMSATVTLGQDRHYHIPLLASPASGVVYLGR